MQKVSIVSILAILLMIFYLYQNDTGQRTKDELIRETFDATCTIDSIMGGCGTGVLLDTGYILTSAHLFDKKNGDKIMPMERLCMLSFSFGTVPGRVAIFGKEDFAIVEPMIDLRSRANLVASSRDEILGERIYTVGAMCGRALHVTEGFVSLPDDALSRASCFISGGNSGGAIVSEQNEHLGVVTALGLKNEIETMQLQRVEDGKLKFMTITIPRSIEVNAMCLFIPMRDIRGELINRGFQYFLDVQDDYISPLDYLHTDPMALAIELIILKLLIFLSAVIYVRKHIFS